MRRGSGHGPPVACVLIAALLGAGCTAPPPIAERISARPTAAPPSVNEAAPSPTGPSATLGRWTFKTVPGPATPYRPSYIEFIWSPGRGGAAARPWGPMRVTVACPDCSGGRIESTFNLVPAAGAAEGDVSYAAQFTFVPGRWTVSPIDQVLEVVGPRFDRLVAAALVRTHWAISTIDQLQVKATTWGQLASAFADPAPPRPDRAILVVGVAGAVLLPSPNGRPYPWGIWVYDAKSGEEVTFFGRQHDPPGLPAAFTSWQDVAP